MSEKKVTLIKMQNDAGKLADVHPVEVENFKLAGFREVKQSGTANKK